MTRRRFLRLLGLAPAAALVAPARSRWTIEWMEKYYPYDGDTVYTMKATQGDQTRWRSWVCKTCYGPAQGQQRREIKAAMREWTHRNLA